MMPDEKLGKKERLLKTKDFRDVYKRGLSSRNGAFILYRLPNNLRYNRLGFSISSKNIKLSTERNRIRRLFKEVYRKAKKTLKAGLDIVIVVRKDPGRQVSYHKIENVFFKLAKEAGLA